VFGRSYGIVEYLADTRAAGTFEVSDRPKRLVRARVFLAQDADGAFEPTRLPSHESRYALKDYVFRRFPLRYTVPPKLVTNVIEKKTKQKQRV